MKNLIWVVVLVGAAAVGYFVMMDRTEEAPTPAPVVKEEAPAPVVEETVEDAVEEVVEEVKEKAEEMVEEAKDKVEDAAKEAVEGAMDKVEGMTDAAKDVAADAAESAVETVTGNAGMADLFTVEGFDFSKVSEMIDGSALDALKKTTLKAALEQAQNNPELLKAALENVKSALGM